MLKIQKAVKDIPCFSTNSKKDCFLVQFKDGSFSGVLCWDALLEALKRKFAEGPTAETTPKKIP